MGVDIMEKEKKPLPVVQKDTLLIEDLQVKHLAEVRRLKEAAEGREQALLEQLRIARRQLVVVVIIAVVSIAGIWHSRAGSKDTVQPVLPAAAVAVQAAVPAAQPAVATLPAKAPVAQQAPASLPSPAAMATPAVVQVGAASTPKAGNGGNFSGGKSSSR